MGKVQYIHICFIQSTDLNADLIQKHPCRDTQGNVGPNSWTQSWPSQIDV